MQFRRNPEFLDAVKVFESPSFRQALSAAESKIRPLCNASFRLQRDETTLADVVRSYGDIFCRFLGDEVLIRCAEKRWGSCEQPLFMLGYALHPPHADSARSMPVGKLTSVDAICNFAVHYFRRFLSEAYGELRGDMFKWLNEEFTFGKASEFDDALKFWLYTKTTKPKSLLPVLAIIVLLIMVSTATCQRLSSELALIHTPRRNRMSSQKSKSIQIVRKQVRAKDSIQSSPSMALHFVSRVVDPTERRFVAEDVQGGFVFDDNRAAIDQDHGSDVASSDPSDDDHPDNEELNAQDAETVQLESTPLDTGNEYLRAPQVRIMRMMMVSQNVKHNLINFI